MLSQVIGELLPLAAAVALSPVPIIAIVLVLDGAHARARGLAFTAGWIAGLTALSALIVVVTDTASDPGTDAAAGINWLMAVIGALFLVMAGLQFKNRPRRGEVKELPSWLSSLASVSTMKAMLLGVVAAAANPKNLALVFGAAAAIANAGLDPRDEVVAIAAFVALGSLSVLVPVAFYLVAPRRAQGPLAATKQFMIDNTATIAMIILTFIGVTILGDALAGLWS